MTDRRSPLDAALDLVLYVPVGLALTVSEEVPKLAAKGRSTLGARVTTARVVGQFAVAQGRREVNRRMSGPVTPPAPPAAAPSRPAGAAASATTGGTASSGPPASPTAVLAAKAAARGASMPPAAPPAPTGAPPAPTGAAASGDLAIPGYDSLSASQVVQRLAGLSMPELDAVKAYESANRGRRTILARVGQLQAH